MYQYHLVSVWKVKAYQEVAWRTISDQEKWIRWWPGIKKVTVTNNGGTDAVGKKYHHIWKGILLSDFAFDLQVTTFAKPYLLEATATGELEGKLKWEVTQDGDTTILTYTADLQIAKPWINKWENYLKPLFKGSYETLMKRGARALSKRLETKMVQCKTSIEVHPLPLVHLQQAAL
jgi:carbon monoxide dehydrogenase subunit G